MCVQVEDSAGDKAVKKEVSGAIKVSPWGRSLLSKSVSERFLIKMFPLGQTSLTLTKGVVVVQKHVQNLISVNSFHHFN